MLDCADKANVGSAAMRASEGWRARASTGPASLPTTTIGADRRIDELFTAWPFLGSRQMTLVSGRGLLVNRKRVQRLMRLMGLRRSTEAEGPSRRPGTGFILISCAIWR